MATISANAVKDLREKTGVGMMEAKNEEFQRFARGLAEIVAGKDPADVAALSQMPFDGGSVEARRQTLVQKIGENIAVRRFIRYETDGNLAIYLHGSRIGGKVGYTVGGEQSGQDPAL